VFLAHSKEDKPFVREIFFLLKLDGFYPWIDEESLVAGQDWEFEIEKAVKQSHVVVLFISPSGVDRAGYLHKEIMLAIDIAEQQPEGTIFLIPVRLGKCEMPQRLGHLHWLIPDEPNSVANVYCRLQDSLLVRAAKLGLITQDELGSMPLQHLGVKGIYRPPLKGRKFIVRGQNPDGSRYYGTSQLNLSGEKSEMTWNISGCETKCEVVQPPKGQNDTIRLLGDYEVTYTGPSWMGIYEGTWDDGGTEELIPASPLAGRRHI
jgi:hypothetical protein